MKQRIRQWLNRRSPHQDQFGLGIHNIYVFFSRQGLLYLFLLIITFMVGTNYGNNLVLGLFFYLGSVWLMSAIVTFLQLSRLEFEFVATSPTPAHSIAWVRIAITSHSGTPARQIALAFDYNKDDLAKLSLADQATFNTHREQILAEVGKKTEISLPIITGKRGIMALPRLNIHSTYPLGITRAWAYGFFASPCFIYPAPKPVEGKSGYSQTLDDTGTGGRTVLGVDDFDRLDSYQEGESLASVSWGHVARGMGMLTKHFGDTVSPSETLDYYAMPAMHHEERLSELVFLLLKKEKHTPFSLILPSGKSPLGAGDGFVEECLVRLAKEP